MAKSRPTRWGVADSASIPPVVDLRSRPLRRAISVGASASVVAVALASASVARADNDQCYATYEAAQKQRNSGDLLAAHESLKVCADPSCPAAVTTDCVPWLSAVEASLPTVTFVVKDEKGGDLEDVTVELDDKPLVTKLDGKAVSVNPGVHTFKFSASGRNGEEKKVTVHEGEKARTIDVTLAPSGSAVGGSATGTKHKNLAVPFGITAGIGVVGLGLWGVFGGLGLAAKSDAESTCKPNCTDDQVGKIKTDFLVADIGMGVGIAGAVSAMIVGIAWGTSSSACDPSADKDCKAKPAAALVVAPTVGGAALVLGGSF